MEENLGYGRGREGWCHPSLSTFSLVEQRWGGEVYWGFGTLNLCVPGSRPKSDLELVWEVLPLRLARISPPPLCSRDMSHWFNMFSIVPFTGRCIFSCEHESYLLQGYGVKACPSCQVYLAWSAKFMYSIISYRACGFQRDFDVSLYLMCDFRAHLHIGFFALQFRFMLFDLYMASRVFSSSCSVF